MTLMAYILSLALTFCCSTLKECQDLRAVTYDYIDVADFSFVNINDEVHAVDYRIRETLYFVDSDDNSYTKEYYYDVPLCSDWNIRNWHDAVSLISHQRGVEITDYSDTTASGKVSEKLLDAYTDLYNDGYVNKPKNLDYLDTRSLELQQTKYMHYWVAFSLFYTMMRFVNDIFRFWIKPRKENKGGM